MNKLTAAESPFYVGELLSPISQPMAQSRLASDSKQVQVIPPQPLGWLDRMTNRSYEAWLARGGLESSVE